MGRSFYGQTDAALDAGSRNFSRIISLDPPALGLTVQQTDDYAAADAAWRGAYEACRDPALRTRVAVARKNAARAVIRAMAAALARIINAAPSLTDARRIELGLAIRTKPAPIGPPTATPRVRVLGVIGRRVMVRIHDDARRGKPAGAAAAWIHTFVGAQYPTDDSRWHLAGAATRAKHTLVFPDDLPAGQSVWIRALWINPRQQPGPASFPITTNLQGGGAAMTMQPPATSEIKAAA